MGGEWDRLRKQNEMTWAEIKAAVAYDPWAAVRVARPEVFAFWLDQAMANKDTSEGCT